MTVEYFVPLAVISFAYIRIAFRLWGSKTPGAAQVRGTGFHKTGTKTRCESRLFLQDERDHNIMNNKKKVYLYMQKAR